MIKDIESGKINMIITKDMSRLGRDYIGTGELIEKYFPNKNVMKRHHFRSHTFRGINIFLYGYEVDT